MNLLRQLSRRDYGRSHSQNGEDLITAVLLVCNWRPEESEERVKSGLLEASPARLPWWEHQGRHMTRGRIMTPL